VTDTERSAVDEPDGNEAAGPAEMILDERGFTCPHPVIALGRAGKAAPPGTRIDVLADDPAAETDVPAWCRMTGAEFFGATPDESDGQSPERAGAARRYRVRTRRSAGPAARA
jgi:TusA-related sulfurtransferase